MRLLLLSVICLCVSFCGLGEDRASANSTSGKAATNGKPAGQTLITGRSITFIENRGQFDSEVKFQARSGNKVLWFTRTGIVFDVVSLSGQEKGGFAPVTFRKGKHTVGALAVQKPGPKMDRLVFAETFGTQEIAPRIEASGPRSGTYNYFIGNDPAKWRTGVASYSQLLYREVWPGVDVRFAAKGWDVEQEFLVHPGADASSIHVNYSGVDRLETPNDGSMVVKTRFGPLRESSPRIYQEADGHQAPIQGKYAVSGLEYKFELGSYNGQQSLVIDPTLLFSTYIGSSGQDVGTAIAVDASGNTYIAGATHGAIATPYPTTPGAFQATPPDASSAVVSKFDPLGNLAYSTYLGGFAGGDNARGVGVNSNGEAYVTGVSSSGFPTTSNAFQQACGSSTFMSQLNAAGSALLYSTCVGNEGYGAEYGAGVNAIAVNAAGRAYLTGSTGDQSFPVTSDAFQQSLSDQASAFVSVIDPSLSGSASLIYSTHLGGEVSDDGTAIAVDSFGNAYVTGNTASDHFPITPNAFQTTDPQNVCYNEGGPINRCFTGFVAKLNPAVAGAAGLIYSSYLGGSVGNYNGFDRGDYPTAIAVDSSGNAYVVGETDSANFPITPGAFETSSNCTGGANGFATKISPGGSSLIYSTFLGCGTLAAGVALNPSGNVYVVGNTGAGLVVTADAFQSVPQGNGDAFLTELSASGASLVYSSYLGGGGGDGATAIALDAANDVYLVGNTSSYDFPVTPFAFQPTLASDPNCVQHGPCQDMFVTKFPLGGLGGLSIKGIEPNLGGNAGTITPQIVGSGFHAGAMARLDCGGRTVTGSNVIFGTLGRILNATFDLRNVRAGKCDMVITNADGTSAQLAQSFTVQQGGQPNIQISVFGVAVRQAVPEIPDAPTNAIFEVVAENRGNVDLPGGILSLPFPSPFIETSTYPQDLAGQGSAGVIWTLGVLPGRSAKPLLATATTTPSVASTHNTEAPAHLRVGARNLATTNAPFTCDASDMTVTACFSEYTSSFDQNVFAGCLTNENSYLQAGIGVGCAGTIVGAIGTCLATAPLITPRERLICAVGGIGSSAAVCGLERTNPFRIFPYCARAASHTPTLCVNGVTSCAGPSDPNTLTGPAGVTSQRWISPDQLMSYLITFQNEADATAPAQKVVLTQPLDAGLDLSKLGVLTITIPNGTNAVPVNIPPGSFEPAIGLNEYVTNVDLRPTQEMLVNIDVKLDSVSRSLTWTFITVDPSTGQPPLNPLIGFLQASTSGSVAFNIKPNSNVETGMQISDQATILFIGSSPMNTPAWTNTIDNTAPVSSINALSAIEDNPMFRVTWSGKDAGSGIKGYTVYVSDNGGPFTAWQTNTTPTTATYSGETGHTYSFYSIATDLVGNIEPPKATAEATTTVQTSSACETDVSAQVAITRGGFRYNHATKSFVQTVSLTNTGTPVTVASLVLDNLSADATLVGAGGKTACAAPLGSPWIPVPGTLATGQSISLTLTFSDPKQGGIQYSTRILAGNGKQ